MINREATIRWKGYDPDDLSPGSNKKVWAVCDKCGKGRWVIKQQYRDLCHKCGNNTKNHCDKISKSHIKRFEDPLEREKVRERTIKQFEDPEQREKARNIQIELWDDPERREKAREKSIEQFKDPKIREKLRIKGIEKWKDPEKRKLESIREIERWKDPIVHEKASAIMQGIPYEEWTGFSERYNNFKNCIFLNDWFPGCHRHHIAETIITCIPAKLHFHIKHCLKTGYNMGEINILALQYVFGDILCSIYNGCDI